LSALAATACPARSISTETEMPLLSAIASIRDMAAGSIKAWLAENIMQAYSAQNLAKGNRRKIRQLRLHKIYSFAQKLYKLYRGFTFA
jgi:hypothetical protein